MEQQGGSEAFRRDEALVALAVLSIYAPGFLYELRTNPESTLWRYGFALSPDEMREARDYFAERASLSDDEIVRGLREQIGGEPYYKRWFRP